MASTAITDIVIKKSYFGTKPRLPHTVGTYATNWATMVNWRKVSFTGWTVKKVENKIVYYKETVECVHLIFWSRSQKKVHCHTAKPELNWRVTIDQIPLLVFLYICM
jgi:hypothetical protein